MALSSEIIAAVIAVLGAAGVAIVTQRMTERSATTALKRQNEQDARRFREERTWEARKVAYSEILTHCRGWEVLRRAIDQGYNGEWANPHGYDSSGDAKENARRSQAAFQAMFEALDRHRVIVSAEFADRMLKLADDLNALDPHEDIDVYAAKAAEIATAAYSSLLQIAQGELGA